MIAKKFTGEEEMLKFNKLRNAKRVRDLLGEPPSLLMQEYNRCKERKQEIFEQTKHHELDDGKNKNLDEFFKK